MADDITYMDEIVVNVNDNIWSKEKMNSYRVKYSNEPPLMFSVYDYNFGGALGVFYHIANSTYLGIEIRQMYNYHKTTTAPYYINPYLLMREGFGIISINIRF